MNARVETLLVKENFVRGQIICRFLNPVHKEDTLIIAIPGGPGLSNRYLDSFMLNLAETTGTNVGVIDLPNHGESKIVDKKVPLSYPESLEFIQKTIAELRLKVKNLVVFGQSLGARFAFDLLAQLPSISATMLTGLPYVFQMSKELIAELNQLPLQSESGPEAETIRKNNLRKTLSLYTREPLKPDLLEGLIPENTAPGIYNMLTNTPPIEEITKRIPNSSPILIVESHHDPVVPNGNWTVLRAIASQAKFIKMENTGHFPMLEQPKELLSIFKTYMKDLRII